MKIKSSVVFIRVWLTLMVVVNAWIMTQSVLLIDSARDFSYALNIAQGVKWHLMGPEFGGFLHTGPFWFYLLAIPILSGSLWLTAFAIGLLAGLKFVLAFHLGKNWVNTRFGLLWSACLLIPGWHSLNTFIPGHVNVIDTLVLAYVWALWRYALCRQFRWLYLSGLLLALSMHAHVTALICVILYGPLLWRTYGHWRLRDLMITGFLFLLPFVPYVAAQIMDGFGDWIRWQALSQEIDQIKSGLTPQKEHFISALLGNLKALLMGGAHRIYGFVLSVWPLMGVVYAAIFSLLLTVIVIVWGWRLSSDQSNIGYLLKQLLRAFGLLILGLGLITALRSFTPFYMLFVLTSLLAFIWAWLLSAGGWLNHRFTIVLVVVLMILGGFPNLALQKAVYDGQVHLGPVRNVRQVPNDDWITDYNTMDALTVADSDRWGQFLCSENMQIHGPGAMVLDLLSALPTQLTCPQNTVLLGGKPQQDHRQLLLMHRSFWNKTRLEPDAWVTPAWGMSEHIELYNEYEPLKPVDFNNYIHPPRSSRIIQERETISKDIKSDKGSLVLISHLLPFYTGTSVKEITANGHKADIIMENIGNRLYYCGACDSEPVKWQISLSSNDPAAIDLLIINEHE